jgi:hypothetical protein
MKKVELDDEIGGVEVKVSVVKGKEKENFIKILNGEMIIMSGGKEY